MKKITIIITLLIFCLQIKAQSTEFELLTSRTWSKSTKPDLIRAVGKTNYNKDNIMINIYDLYVNDKFIEKIRFIAEFYLSDTPDKVFDENKKKNKKVKYIILKNTETKEITQKEIVSISKNKLIIVLLRSDNKRHETESTGIDKIDIK